METELTGLGTVHTMLFAGWIGMLAGVVSGSIIGLYFHREEWLGGYGSFPRRMVRLGHISFFGLGFINILFALTLTVVSLHDVWANTTATCFILGAVTMPLCCYLCAWQKKLWFLFTVPVGSELAAIIIFLLKGVWL